MTRFESFTIYPMPRKRYAEVKEFLIENGYKLVGSEWEKGDDCITTTSYAGEFMTHKKDSFQREKTYTVDEFMAKFKLNYQEPLTSDEVKQLRELFNTQPPPDHEPPLTPDERKKFRELLKVHRLNPEPQPKPKTETYEGVFSFDIDGANCNHVNKWLYWIGEEERWGVIGSAKTEPHTLIEAPHQVGEFYLLNIGNVKNDPTSYGLYDGSLFWHWTKTGCIVSTATATNLKVVKE
jgi:hypothetical protein